MFFVKSFNGIFMTVFALSTFASYLLYQQRLNFLLVAIWSFVFARCSLVFTRCSIILARCLLHFDCCLLLFGRYLLLFARCSLLFACFLSLFTRCSLYLARCSLPFRPSYVLKVQYRVRKNTIESVIISVLKQ